MTTAKRAPKKTFDEWLHLYRAYRDAHGTDPKQTDPDGAVRSLADWLGQRRQADRAGTLDPGLGAALDQVNPRWRETAWSPAGKDRRVAEYQAYRDAHGTDPRENDPDKAVRSLAGWLTTQRKEDRAGTLDPGLGAALDQVNPRWRETAWSPAGKDRRVAEYQAYREVHGTDPKTKDPDDAVRSLAKWLHRQRVADRAGTLDPALGAALDQVNPSWRETRSSPAGKDRRVAEYQSYRDAHGTDPKTHDPDKAVRSLTGWLTRQRVADRAGTLDPALGAALDGVNPRWRETARSLVKKDRMVAEYRSYRDAHGSDPKTNDPDDAVRSLAWWLGQRRAADRAGTLDPALGAALDVVHPGWRTSDTYVTTGRLIEFVKDLLGSMSTMTEMAQQTVIMQDDVDAARADLVVATARKIRTGKATIDEAEALIAAGNVDETDDVDVADVEVSPVGDGTDLVDTDETESDRDVPVSATRVIDGGAAALAHLGRSHSTDEEAYEFLVAAPVNQLWAQAYAADPTDPAALDRLIAETEEPRDNVYAETIRAAFREQLDAALACAVPAGWSFRQDPQDPDGPVVAPNLMQRHVATQLVKRRRLGNWSGTGAGKTLSAVLAARIDGAGHHGIVLVVCPNAVVENWSTVAQSAFPDTRVATKTLHPTWEVGDGPRWLVVNYEMLSGSREGQIRALIETHGVDMLIVDEVHFVKVRKGGRAAARVASQRRKALEGIATHTFEGNPDAALMVMSATPVINELHEAISLLELVEGTELKDLEARPTVTNCVKVHQHLVRFGVRFKPEDAAAPDITFVPVDATHLTDELLASRGSVLGIEQVMVQAKIPTIVDAALSAHSRGSRTLVYTELLNGIVGPIKAALEAVGLRVGEYNGDKKDGLRELLGHDANGSPVPTAEQVDVLIGSISISTGVDGLQKVVDTLVFAGLPWTHAGWEQVVGRVLRQGQTSDLVRVVTPVCTVTEPNGDATSPDTIRRDLIRNKRTLAEAVIEGALPARHGLLSPEKIGRRWLARLAAGQEVTVTRSPLDVRLGDDAETPAGPARGRTFSELSRMNAAWGASSSATTHARLVADPTKWHDYHRQYGGARSTWDMVPAYRFAGWLNERPAGKVVADLGCGQNLLAAATTTVHDIRGFDHVAFDDTVTVCDIAHTPLPNGSVDIAVLSLALMGTNHTDYLVEARRILTAGGQLWLAEPASSIGKDENRLQEVLMAYGFVLWNVEVSDRFTILQATRSVGRLAAVLPPIKESSTDRWGEQEADAA